MAQAPGTRLGPYEIQAPVGAGGMGEVYRARDTRLERTVAIKILPDTLASDAQFRARFDQEARTISRLDHPHICAIYDVGTHEGTAYLVMQYLEGETLAARLAAGPLPLHEALPMAVDIADALDTAHGAGIVHRDLKPGNVMLTRKGATLLDFGLAKSGGSVVAGAAGSMLPTTPALTAQGTILGTFQYMAPEQLEGLEADPRTDLFAFGAVLYEMVTGRKAFEGASHASLIASIMTAQPPSLKTADAVAPALLDDIIRRCLAKDPAARWQTARDLRAALAWVGTPEPVALPGQVAAKGRRRAWIAASLLVGLLIAAGAWVLRTPVGPPGGAAPVRFAVAMPEGVATVGGTLALSPDGRWLVFDGTPAGGRRVLWLRRLDSTTISPLAGSEGAAYPFWSPDSRFIGFFADQRLKTLELSGGKVETVASVGGGGGGGTWNDEGVIVFAPSVESPLSRVAASGGTPTPLTTLDRSHGETNHIWPHFLPDGRHYLFQLFGADNSGIYLGSLDSSEQTRLIAQESLDLTAIVYADPGYLLYVSKFALMAQPFDLDSRRLTGEPVRLAEGFGVGGPGRPEFAASRTGVLAYRVVATAGTNQLTWFDRAGRMLGRLGTPGRDTSFDVSPDERTVAVERPGPLGTAIWLLDVARGAATRLTSDPLALRPLWTPDGDGVVVSAVRDTPPNLFLYQLSGGERRLVRSPAQTYATDWSPDGRLLVYNVYTLETYNDIWTMSMPDGRESRPMLATRADEQDAHVSPDGHWFTFASNETGQAEIYIAAFPEPGRRFLVSTNGGASPRWRKDGRELFYRNAGKLYAAPVALDGVPQAGTPRELFALPPGNRSYVPAANGQRFLINVETANPPQQPIEVVVNWAAELAP